MILDRKIEGRVYRTLLFFFFVLEMMTLSIFRNAMYSPLNQQPKRLFHDHVLAQSKNYVDSWKSGAVAAGKKSAINTQRLSTGVSNDRTIVILTAPRKEQYLDACLWSLFQYNDPEWLNSTSIVLLNALANYNPDLERWEQQHGESLLILSAKTRRASWEASLVHNHIRALQLCHNKTPWCIILEDDAIFTRKFIAKFHEAVEIPMKSASDLALVKLFVSDHWQGFSYSLTHVYDMLYVMILALCFLLLVLYCVGTKRGHASPQPTHGNRSSRHSPRQERRNFCVAYTICVLGFYLAWRIMGRQTILNLLEHQALHLDDIRGPTASTVAIAYPQNVLSLLIQHLQSPNLPPKPIDEALNDWLTGHRHFKAWRTRPSLVQHIGAYSSAGFKNQGNFKVMKQDSSFVF
jgi:GR25 family glycosyltransferase involved in LPS biosynthesis